LKCEEVVFGSYRLNNHLHMYVPFVTESISTRINPSKDWD